MASQESRGSKKRKSTSAHDGGAPSEVEVVFAETPGAGPAFVNFPSVRPNKKVPFTTYSRSAAPSMSSMSEQQSLIAGETEDVEFYSTNRDRESGEGNDCQYVAALYDPSTGKLHVTPTPLYLLAHRVKRMRELDSGVESAQAITEWKAKRNDLGEVFGTRKAKSQIRAEERNKVDINAMQGVRDHLISSIAEKEQSEDAIPPPEVIPTPNLETKDVTQVYPRSAIIPDNEWSSIDVTPIVNAKDDRERSDCLPYRRSRWIGDKLRVAVDGPSNMRKNSLRMLFYLSCLMDFNNFAPRLPRTSPAELPQKLPGIPQQVLSGLLQRFAEPDGKRYKVTDKCKLKLLMWICVCYLAADGWSVSISRVAKDLNLPPTKITDCYKSLGCSVDLPSPAEREKYGLSLADAQTRRRANLKAPVKFPKTKRRGPVKR